MDGKIVKDRKHTTGRKRKPRDANRTQQMTKGKRKPDEKLKSKHRMLMNSTDASFGIINGHCVPCLNHTCLQIYEVFLILKQHF